MHQETAPAQDSKCMFVALSLSVGPVHFRTIAESTCGGSIWYMRLKRLIIFGVNRPLYGFNIDIVFLSLKLIPT